MENKELTKDWKEEFLQMLDIWRIDMNHWVSTEFMTNTCSKNHQLNKGILDFISELLATQKEEIEMELRTEFEKELEERDIRCCIGNN
jgi:hypothetical protein